MESCLDKGLLLTCAAISLGLLGGCSAIIDVQPDCSERSDCGAYECNEANTACKSVCSAHSDCASGFVCLGAQSLCEGGLCASEFAQVTALDSEEKVSDLSLGAIRFSNGNALLLVPTISDSSLLLHRFDGKSVSARPFSGEVGAPKLDGALYLRTPIRVLAADRSGFVRLLWNASVGGNPSLRSLLYDTQSGAMSPSETLYAHPEGILGQSLRASNSLVDSHVYWVAGASNELNALRVNANGQVSGPLSISTNVLEAEAVSFEGAHHLAWLERTGTGWALYHRVTSDGADHFLGDDAERVKAAAGAPPTGLHLAVGDKGLLAFYQRPTGSGRTAHYMLRFGGDRPVGAERSWLDAFESVERVEIVQHPQGGALAAIAGTWRSERGIWLVQVLSDGSADQIPVRVLDNAPSPVTKVQTLKVAADGSSAWVFWSYARDGELAADVQARAFACSF